MTTEPNTSTEYQTEAGFRSQVESIPVHGDVSPFVRGILREMAARRGDCLGMLLQILSPGRFMPSYWARVGLPDLEAEIRDLQLKERVQSLRGQLADEDVERMRDEVNGAIAAWTEWRRRALAAGLGRVHDATEWARWADQNVGLKGEWDDLTEAIAAAERRIHALAARIDSRPGHAPADTRPGYEVPWTDEPLPGWITNGEALAIANAFGAEHEVSDLVELDLRQLNKLLRRRHVGVQFQSKRTGKPAGRVHKGDWLAYLSREKNRLEATEKAIETRAREIAS